MPLRRAHTSGTSRVLYACNDFSKAFDWLECKESFPAQSHIRSTEGSEMLNREEQLRRAGRRKQKQNVRSKTDAGR